MKFLQTGVMAVCIALFSIHAEAQRIKLTEGSLAALKDEKKIATEFTYDNIKVGKYDKEEDYIKDKKEEYNKKEAGKGDTWAKNWIDDRKYRYEPKFNELFTKGSEIEVDKNAKYTLIFKTTFIEPGYNVGVWRHNAELNGEVWIVETADKNKVIAKLSVDKALGRLMGFDYDTGVRIAETYADAGKALGKFIKSKS